MALTVKDRVKESSTTTGTADFVLVGAAAGFQTFAVIGGGNTTYYAAVDQATGDWEVGVGTYSATGPTLSRDTVLESSNGGSKVSFSAGSKDVFCTYPAERSVYLDAAGSAVTALDVGTLGVGTANITAANITAGTVSTTPANSTDIVNKQYVDNIAVQGTYYHAPVKYETAGALTATYNNGSSGVGATLTNAGTLTAFAPDGIVASVNDRILVYRQADQTQNGIYVVTTVGSGSVAWVLTRASDANTYGLINPNALGQGDAFFVTSGNTGSGETYICNTTGTITFGTTNITFVQVSDTQVYSAGTGLTLSGTEFSITPVGTASTYGSASQVPVFTTNASGQVTSVTDTAIAISSAAVSGLAASATTDTTNAANISSGTLPSARLNGSYTGVTGVGTLTAGTWNAGTIGPTYGGTGFGSYAVGDILYANTTTSLAKLADVASGNALLSGGVGTAPAWGKVGLTTHVSGTLAVANGGTGATTLTGYVYGNGTGAFTAATSIPNSATTATSANTASAIVARDASGNFSAGTITASLAGNATTASTASATTAAVTFNNGGLGAASGTTFNGSTAQTISYNTLGASPLAGSSSLTTTGTVTSGTWSASFGAVSGANLTNLTAGNLSGTIPSAVLGNSTTYVGTTAVALNRASANQALTGITSATFPGATSGSVQLVPAAVAGTGTVLTMPATTGTVVTTGDTGTVTSTMIADGTIVNADISASAAIAVSKLAASTISGVTLGGTLGTLTMNTSGTGLSGSTTYNGSGAATFTVTSNATSANTASTIVARDASGNFTAGTITATLSGNASTATSAGSVTNAVTFNNGGAGGASGSTFNGSGALTVSYNTVGAPSTTGTNASGTWGINISGDAATVDGKSFGTFTAAGGILYATSTTAASAIGAGTSGQVLTSGAAGAPTWTSQSSLSVGSASTATTATTATNATNATYTASGTSGSGGVVYENPQTISSNYTMTTNYNGMSAGPITVATGVTVTIPTGSSWSIV